jgi:hypothetical protein
MIQFHADGYLQNNSSPSPQYPHVHRHCQYEKSGSISTVTLCQIRCCAALLSQRTYRLLYAALLQREFSLVWVHGKRSEVVWSGVKWNGVEDIFLSFQIPLSWKSVHLRAIAVYKATQYRWFFFKTDNRKAVLNLRKTEGTSKINYTYVKGRVTPLQARCGPEGG